MSKFKSKEEKLLAVGSWIFGSVWAAFLLSHGMALWAAIFAGSVVSVLAQAGPKWAANRLLVRVEARAWANAQLVMEAMASYYDEKERRATGYAAYRVALKGVIKEDSINAWWDERWSS